jgi:hypothetical protein
MKKRVLLIATLLSSFISTSNLRAQSSTIFYQGNLRGSGGVRVDGSFDLTFTLFDSSNVPGSVIAGPLTNAATAVSNGLFSVTLDFGASPFNGSPCWLEMGVRTNGRGAFTILAPRQLITSTPYAVQALNAGNAVNYSGIITDSQLSTNIARLSGGNVFTGAVNVSSDLSVAGTMTGNGAGLTNVPLTGLQQGGARSGQILSNNGVAWVPATSPSGGAPFNGANTWTGTNTFTTNVLFGGPFEQSWFAPSTYTMFLPSDGSYGFEIYGDYRNGTNGERYMSGFNPGDPGFHTTGTIEMLGDGMVEWIPQNAAANMLMGCDTDVGMALYNGINGWTSANLAKMIQIFCSADQYINAPTNATFPGGNLRLTIDALGDISTLGALTVAGTNNITNNLPAASTTTMGAVKVDGSTITVDESGVISLTGNGAGLSNLSASSLTGLIPQGQYGTSTDFISAIGDGIHDFPNIISHAHYTAVGGLVFVEIALSWSGGHNGANEASAVVINLPLAVTASYRVPFTLAWVNGITFSRQLTAGAGANSTAVQIFDLKSGGVPKMLSVSNCAASGEIQLSGVFRQY